MNSVQRIFNVVSSIAGKSGINADDPQFLEKVKSSIYNSFLNDESRVPVWLVQSFEAVYKKNEIPQTSFEEGKNDGDVDNFMHTIAEILKAEIQDEGEMYIVDFDLLEMQLIVMRQGSTFETVNYG